MLEASRGSGRGDHDASQTGDLILCGEAISCNAQLPETALAAVVRAYARATATSSHLVVYIGVLRSWRMHQARVPAAIPALAT